MLQSYSERKRYIPHYHHQKAHYDHKNDNYHHNKENDNYHYRQENDEEHYPSPTLQSQRIHHP